MIAFFTVVALSLFASSSLAVPLERRISQTISNSTVQWEQACLAAGGALQCRDTSVIAFSTLLPEAGVCDQQNAADSMIDLAYSLGGDSEMIRLAQIFVQQPRNSPEKLQVPYCQLEPHNHELHGLFQCQFEGTVANGFSGDQTGNIPLGLDAPVHPAGACPAWPTGPVKDGEQLVDSVSEPISSYWSHSHSHAHSA